MYSPRIQDNQIKRLYLLAKEFGVPMTKLVKTAIEEYLERYEKVSPENEGQKPTPASVKGQKPLKRSFGA